MLTDAHLQSFYTAKALQFFAADADADADAAFGIELNHSHSCRLLYVIVYLKENTAGFVVVVSCTVVVFFVYK